MTEVIEALGEPHARGVQLGRALKSRIARHLAAWLRALRQATGEDGETYARALLADTRFRVSCAVHTPDLLAEVDGIAAGAELDPDLVFALQLMDEEWAYRSRRRGGLTPHKCSSAALVGTDGATAIGQNMDLGPYTDGFQLMTRVGGGTADPAALMLTTAGLIGLVGVNAAKVAVCVNALPQLPNAGEGVPVAFMIRRLLQARDLEEACGWVRRLPHATNQHYLIGASGAFRSFEASAAGVTELSPTVEGRLFHTNHPLAAVKGDPEPPEERANSAARLASLEARLATGPADGDALRAALSAKDDPRHPVCREYDPAAGLIGFTTGSMVSVLRPGSAPVETWASLGPPSLRGYRQIEPAFRVA